MKSNVKWLDVGNDNNNNQVGGRTLPAGNTPSNYTPSEESNEGTDKISAHLNGIDSKLGNLPQNATQDVDPNSISLVNNQSTFTNITAIPAFSGASTIGFTATFTVQAIATANVSETFTINAAYDFSEWNFSMSSVGSESGVDFNITSTGQIQYKSSNLAGFTSGKISYRIDTTPA